MFVLASIAPGLSLSIAAVAAISDWRSGTIPNWLTLPPIAGAPLVYGVSLGFAHALQCLAAIFLSGIGPYLLFRRGGMGGGDVKLFAAIGAATGFDPLMGLRIQFGAFATALGFALCLLAWRGKLLSALAAAATMGLGRLLPERLSVGKELLTPIRMGGAIFVATALNVRPFLLAEWSGL